MSQDLVYQESVPSPRAAALVSAYWTALVGPTWDPDQEHAIWPDGCVSLSVPQGGAARDSWVRERKRSAFA